MQVFKSVCLALLLVPLAAHAAPEINVGGLYDYLEEGKSTALKRIYNSGTATAFIKVSVAELVYDQDGEPREVDLEQLPLEQRGVVASPARLIVPARGQQSVRLLYRGERDKERYFRLRFIPVLPEKDDGFSLSEAQAQDYRDSLKAGVQLLAGYGTLLFVRPTGSRYQTPMTQQGGQLVVTNNGNATVVLDNFRHCAVAGRDCVDPTKHHLLPGVTRKFPEQPGREYRFELQEGSKREVLAFKE
ncbi:molecular chaperone [Pseudomonas guariconensis]|uniref:molecular chaperone n=1 Tax=Pseudomonas guariconensis TaxID=1288410 RepID=UPI0018AC09A1|nr:molecular chaperone [Pseudomonas guariconensis]MBF8723386.1 molecular chaperone [Pseudomonas guariconensis]MBF8795296.1 molecular chaperone [Pseudomonas monteilii]